MYEKVNILKELKTIPQKELLRFLSTQLNSNESLQKEFIKRFNLSIQKKFIQDYYDEFKKALKKYKKSIQKGVYYYNSSMFNSQFLSQKISYLTVLEKQGEYLEALKLCLVIYTTLSTIIAVNGKVEDLSIQTTADKLEKKWMKFRLKLVELYSKIDEEEYYLFDRKTFFTILIAQYSLLLHSNVFNFIFVREHAKLQWMIRELRDEDKKFFDTFLI